MSTNDGRSVQGGAAMPIYGDGGSIGISGTLTTRPATGPATLSSVNDTNVSTTLLAANTARLVATIANDSTAILYVALAATASATSYTAKLFPDDVLVVSGYIGIITGIWSADASGAARITEIIA